MLKNEGVAAGPWHHIGTQHWPIRTHFDVIIGFVAIEQTRRRAIASSVWGLRFGLNSGSWGPLVEEVPRCPARSIADRPVCRAGGPASVVESAVCVAGGPVARAVRHAGRGGEFRGNQALGPDAPGFSAPVATLQGGCPQPRHAQRRYQRHRRRALRPVLYRLGRRPAPPCPPSAHHWDSGMHLA